MVLDASLLNAYPYKVWILCKVEPSQERRSAFQTPRSSDYWKGCARLRSPTTVTNEPGDLGSIPGRVIPKTQKMVLDAALLNTKHEKVQVKRKWMAARRPTWLVYIYIYIYIYILRWKNTRSSDDGFICRNICQRRIFLFLDI